MHMYRRSREIIGSGEGNSHPDDLKLEACTNLIGDVESVKKISDALKQMPLHRNSQ